MLTLAFQRISSHYALAFFPKIDAINYAKIPSETVAPPDEARREQRQMLIENVNNRNREVALDRYVQ